MTETIINLDTVNPIEFFGVNNSKFDILKKKFPLLKILSRGTQIKLSGAPEQIEVAKEKIELIIQYMERNGHLSENYFEQILGGDDAEVIDNFIDKNPNEVLVIDPEIVFSTYSGSSALNFGYTATFDTAGHGYAGGTVFSFGFPSSAGAYQMTFAGGNIESNPIGYTDRDCGIIKYSKDGKSILFSTYLGGSISNEQPHSMIVDSKNNLLVMGTTKSSDFPIGIAPAFDDSHNGLSDIFVVKFSEDGSQLLSGTFVGGTGFDGLNGDRPSNNTSALLYNYADDFRGEIIVDDLDNVFVASSTTSSVDFRFGVQSVSWNHCVLQNLEWRIAQRGESKVLQHRRRIYCRRSRNSETWTRAERCCEDRRCMLYHFWN